MMPLIPALLVMAAVFALGQVMAGAILSGRDERRAKLARRITLLKESHTVLIHPSLMRRDTLSDIPLLHRLLARAAFALRLKNLIEQSGAKVKPGFIVLSCLALGAGAYLVVSWVSPMPGIGPLAGLIAASLPVAHLRRLRSKRIARFQEQLPEALELMVRSLRAGHAFTTSLQIISDEFAEPLGQEFKKVIEEVNFGVSMPKALGNFAARIPSPDLKFFVVSVSIQRDVGGNLTEILSTIAKLIRDRAGLARHVRTLSAEGRLTANCMACIPFILAGALHVMNPEYMGALPGSPLGRMLIVAALVLMALGIFIIRRLVRIEV